MFFDLYVVTKNSVAENRHMTLANILIFFKNRQYEIKSAFVIDNTIMVVYVEEKLSKEIK